MKILFLVSDDRYFLTHRLALAQAAQQAGHEVIVACGMTQYAEDIRTSGFELIDLHYQRQGLNVGGDRKLIGRIRQVIQSVQPDMVHVVSLRLSLLAAVANLSMPSATHRTIYMITGLGHLFLSQSIKMRLLRRGVMAMLKLAFFSRRAHVVVQNRDDQALFAKLIRTKHLHLIPGSGVDIKQFKPAARTKRVVLNVVMVARAIREKGINEFIAAAQLLKQRGIVCNMILVGGVHEANPSSYKESELKSLHGQGVIEWWGHQDDVIPVLKKTDIAVLPSYREGLPKSLLEAAACGLPIVTTDVTGCRDVVDEKVSGLLVPVKSSVPLADAIEVLVKDSGLRKKMGQAGRQRVEAYFSSDKINQQFLQLYTLL